MARATLKLPNGTSVLIEGTADEVSRMLEHYSGQTPQHVRPPPARLKPRTQTSAKQATEKGIDLAEIVNLVKTCEESENIEVEIVDKSGLVNRVLLPLYVGHEHKANEFGLTSGEISKVTKDLGIPISTQNVSSRLSGAAKSYVVGDKVRRRGQAVRYKLTRKGIKYLKSVLAGK